MLLYKQKKNHSFKGNRFLVSVTVLGSAGPIRFIVNEEELISDVIDMSLKSYAREGRLPVLGSNLNNFLLYCPIAGTEALNPTDKIGSVGLRDFMLCKKPGTEKSIDRKSSRILSRKGSRAKLRKSSGSWKTWFHKSISLKISTH